jgi:hypothetical protein
MPETKTYKVKDDVFEIPVADVSEFLKDMPDAIEVQSFTIEGDTMDIPVADVSEFLKDMPDAQPLKKKEPTMEGTIPASQQVGEPSAILGGPPGITTEPADVSATQQISPTQEIPTAIDQQAPALEEFDFSEKGRIASQLTSTELKKPETKEQKEMLRISRGIAKTNAEREYEMISGLNVQREESPWINEVLRGESEMATVETTGPEGEDVVMVFPTIRKGQPLTDQQALTEAENNLDGIMFSTQEEADKFIENTNKYSQMQQRDWTENDMQKLKESQVKAQTSVIEINNKAIEDTKDQIEILNSQLKQGTEADKIELRGAIGDAKRRLALLNNQRNQAISDISDDYMNTYREVNNIVQDIKIMQARDYQNGSPAQKGEYQEAMSKYDRLSTVADGVNAALPETAEGQWSVEALDAHSAKALSNLFYVINDIGYSAASALGYEGKREEGLAAQVANEYFSYAQFPEVEKLPETFAGKAIGAAIEFIPEVLAIAAIPTSSATLYPSVPAQMTAKLLGNGIKTSRAYQAMRATSPIVVENPAFARFLGTKMTAEYLAESYEKNGAPELNKAIETFVQGYGDGYAMHAIGVASKMAGKAMYSRTGNLFLEEIASQATNVTGFAGYGALNEYISTGQVTRENIEAQVGMALAFNAYNMPQAAKAIATKGYTKLLATDPRSLIWINKNAPKTVEQLQAEAFKIQKEIDVLDKQGDIEGVKRKETELNIINNVADIKLTMEQIKENPEAFKKSTEEIENISPEFRKDIQNKTELIEQLKKEEVKDAERIKKEAEKPSKEEGVIEEVPGQVRIREPEKDRVGAEKEKVIPKEEIKSEKITKEEPVKEKPKEEVIPKEEDLIIMEEAKPKEAIPVAKSTKEARKRAQELIERDRKQAEEDFQTFEIQESGMVERSQTAIQDKFARLKRFQQKVSKEAGREIPEAADIYGGLELMTSKAKNKTDKMTQKVIKSLPKGEKAIFEKMREEKVDLDNLGLYMMAKHAPERNAAMYESRVEEITSLKEKMSQAKSKAAKSKFRKEIEFLEKEIKQLNAESAFSGMSNKTAQEIIKEVEKEGNSETFEKFRQELRGTLIEPMKKEWLESGLESGETIETISAYKEYVPMKVFEKQAKKLGSSPKGTNISGKNIYRLKGPGKFDYTKRMNPITQMLVDYGVAVNKAEKNVVNKRMIEFAKEFPSDVIEIHKPKYIPEYNATGEIRRFKTDIDPVVVRNSLEARVDGKPVYIEFKDPELRNIMQDMGAQRMTNLMKGVIHVNNYMRAINTIADPRFIATNFVRDVQTAGVNISGEGIPKAKRQFVKSIPKAMKGIWEAETGKKSEWADIVNDMKANGGEIGWLDIQRVEDYASRVEKDYKLYNSNKTTANLKRGFNSLAEYVTRVNKVAEQASRVSVYKVAIDNGMSKEKAARLAKNITVNFEKKGTAGTMINTLYLFAGAGIQGSARIISASKSPTVRKLLTGIVASSISMNYLNDMINEQAYDNIEDWEKERNLIFMMPSGNYLKIPLPYGYSVFKVLGDEIYDVSTGKNKVGESLVTMLSAANNSFNPVNSSTLAQMISPTITDPFVQHSENKNWFGAPIKPEQPKFRPKKKESQLYFGGVSKTSKEITDWLDKNTGGSEKEAGFIDVSPELLDHYVSFLTGGVGKFLDQTLTTTSKSIQGEDLELKDIPFVSRFAGAPREKKTLGKIYDYLDDSHIKDFDQSKEQEYYNLLKDAKDKGLIDFKQYKRMKKEFKKGQKEIEKAKE